MTTDIFRAIEDFAARHGGYWAGECLEYPLSSWCTEVRNNHTRLGYWEWAWRQSECEE